MVAPAPERGGSSPTRRITTEEAAQNLERYLTPGLLEAEAAHADGVRTYGLRNRVGILAYGSLAPTPVRI